MNRKNPIIRKRNLPSLWQLNLPSLWEGWGWAFLFLILTACGNNDEVSTSSSTTNETATSISDDYEYELPVVFHVLYKDKNDALQYPSQARLSLIIDSVNALYKRNGMNITFKMATADEDGKTMGEPGVLRHEVNFDDYNYKDFLYKSSSYGEYTQNLKKFINIFLFKFSDEEEQITKGVSVMPVMTKLHPLEGLEDTIPSFFDRVKRFSNPWGICLNNRFVDQNQKWGYVNPDCIWQTLAHELGHYLGLLHSFSENGCDDTDYCSDTKSCDYNAYTKTVSDFLENLTPQERLFITSFYDLPARTECTTGEEYYADNIMDYIYTLGSTFSKQQRNRTRHVLNYCPLMPGVRLEESGTRSSSSIDASPTLFRPRLSNCPPSPWQQ